MIQLSTFLTFMVVLFAFIGGMRGWTKEIVATAGVILALFTLQQFDSVLLQPLLQGARLDQVFWAYAAIFTVIVFFAYQTPAAASRLSEGRMWSDRRVGAQERLLGVLIGAINGYLVMGTLWYFLDRTQYALTPFVTAPLPGSQSSQWVSALPLVFLAQNNLLTILVIVLFLFVIVAMV